MRERLPTFVHLVGLGVDGTGELAHIYSNNPAGLNQDNSKCLETIAHSLNLYKLQDLLLISGGVKHL